MTLPIPRNGPKLRARLLEVCPELVAEIDRIREVPFCEGAKLVRLVVNGVEMGQPEPDPSKVWRLPAHIGQYEAREAERKRKS